MRVLITGGAAFVGSHLADRHPFGPRWNPVPEFETDRVRVHLRATA